MTDKNRIIIFDTTMRDGEQSPGASMSLEEKLQISRVFAELGVDIIEAGFPIASPGDFEAVTEISKTLKRSIPAGLARATKKDIDACHQALKHAKNFRIHTFISTSFFLAIQGIISLKVAPTFSTGCSANFALVARKFF